MTVLEAVGIGVGIGIGLGVVALGLAFAIFAQNQGNRERIERGALDADKIENGVIGHHSPIEYYRCPPDVDYGPHPPIVPGGPCDSYEPGVALPPSEHDVPGWVCMVNFPRPPNR